MIYDLRAPSSGSGGGIPQSIINIIESNTGTQTNVRVLYTEIEWLDGVPVKVSKYTDSGKGTKVYDITIVWSGGVPTSVVSNNLDDGIITTINITWENGVPISINKTEV